MDGAIIPTSGKRFMDALRSDVFSFSIRHHSLVCISCTEKQSEHCNTSIDVVIHVAISGGFLVLVDPTLR